jgi:enoyl-[acyl-carrier-protein] reductase (NADH)
MGLMDGKRGLVVGIANDHSYAYFIAESLIDVAPRRQGDQAARDR